MMEKKQPFNYLINFFLFPYKRIPMIKGISWN